MASAAEQAAAAGERRRGAAAVQPRLLPVADRVAFGFDGEARAVTNRAGHRQPGAREIEALPARQRYAGRSGPLRLLVVGGSLGAQVLNDAVPAALALLPADRAPAHHAPDRQRPTSTPCAPPTPQPACDRRGAALHRRHGRTPGRCDLMVCRAGAITVSELCAAGVPACWCR
jgi:UDP-N-acetylglucosamine--N-acetylmuramyl-(pentapeptide) pyrophosphoryl-undecaprenol N-acetylglucosamine transferase